jgi:hypothetical protein
MFNNPPLSYMYMLYPNLVPFKHPFKSHLHYGENRAKLVGFKEEKKIFCICKTHWLSTIFAMV